MLNTLWKEKMEADMSGGQSKRAGPLQAWSDPEGSRKLRFPDFMTTTQDGCKIVSLSHRPPLPPGNTPGTHFCQRLSRPHGHSATGRIMSLIIPMTPSGMESATCRFVAQCLNHYATARPGGQSSRFKKTPYSLFYTRSPDTRNYSFSRVFTNYPIDRYRVQSKHRPDSAGSEILFSPLN